MYVRDARNRDEAWLLDRIEEMGLDSAAFRSRDYVIAVDESTNERAGFGRYRIHKTDEGEVCELTGIGVVDGWRGQGVGAHVVERLIDLAADNGFEAVYSINGMSVISNEAILYIGTSSASRKSTAVGSNALEKNQSPRDSASSFNSACHSHGVYASR